MSLTDCDEGGLAVVSSGRGCFQKENRENTKLLTLGRGWLERNSARQHPAPEGPDVDISRRMRVPRADDLAWRIHFAEEFRVVHHGHVVTFHIHQVQLALDYAEFERSRALRLHLAQKCIRELGNLSLDLECGHRGPNPLLPISQVHRIIEALPKNRTFHVGDRQCNWETICVLIAFLHLAQAN